MAFINAAAPPMLASSLLQADIDKQAEQTVDRVLSTDCQAIDTALCGGLSYSSTVAIASTSTKTKSLLALHFIASHLLIQSDANVVVLDTSGKFAVSALRDIIIERLDKATQATPVHHSGYVYQQMSNQGAKSPREYVEKATIMLDRVQLTRIFDATGMIEMIAEVRKICDSGSRSTRHAEAQGSGIAKVARSATEDARNDSPSISTGSVLMVIDDFASLLSPLMTANHGEAQALLVSVHRSLRHLARNHGVCTLLLNGVVGIGKNVVAKHTSGGESVDSPSIFESVLGRPALGNTFAGLVDTSLLLSSMPKSRKDAEAKYSGGSASQNASLEYIQTLEVLKDRSGPRQNRICAFDVVDNRRLVGYGD